MTASFYARITGTGLGIPQKIMTNDDLAKLVETNDEWITTRTGIKTRHVAGENEATSDLALTAAKAALAKANLKPEDLDTIIVCTSTPDFPAFPSTAAVLQKKLGAKAICAFDLSAACSGFVYGLNVSRAFIASGQAKKILLVGADVLSKSVNWKDRRTCVLFGDGAGAVVLEATTEKAGVIDSFCESDGGGAEMLIVKKGGTQAPVTDLNDPDQFIYMDGQAVFKFGVRILSECLERILQKNNLKSGEIKWVVPHQANIRILDAAAKRVDIPVENFYSNLSRYVNTSGASIPICLAELDAQGKIQKGDKLIFVGFGAGLTWGAAYVVW